MHAPVLVGLISVASCTPLLAQGVGTWGWEITTQDGDSVVEPGEFATVTLSLDLMPDVGEQQDDGEFVIAFGGCDPLDILGGANADKGVILSWGVNDFLWTPSGNSDGVNINDVTLFQFPQGPTDYSDPIDLLTFTWQPAVYSPFKAIYDANSTYKGDDGFFVYETFGQQDVHAQLWELADVQGVIEVVPTPPALLVAILTALGLAPRRRRIMRH